MTTPNPTRPALHERPAPMQTTTRKISVALAVAAGLLAPVTAVSPAAAGTATEEIPALELLERIEVQEDHSAEDYDRDDYAPSGWVDANGSGCTTREDILARDLDPETISLDGCTVEYGSTTGAFSGEEIEHVQGASDVDVDHLIALSQAHRNGAHAWDNETRQEFYQDPDNLVAVSSSENQSKSDRDASEYLPPNQGAYCAYAGTTIFVKEKWSLTMNPAEHAVITDILTDPECEGTPAAPAQALYTEDWTAAPEATNASENPLDDILDEITGNPLIITGIVAALAVVIALLVIFPKLRRSITRSARRSVKRTVRRNTRKALRF